MSELPLSGKLPGMSSWDWLSEAAPGVALPVPLCCSCCLCGQAMTWINLLSQTKPNSSKKKKEREKLFSTLNHTIAGAGWEREAGI